MSSTVRPLGIKADPRLSGRAVKRIAFDEAAIARRVTELGREISAAYPDGDLLVLGLLKGSFIFLSDLVRQITRPLQVDFLVASSYGDATVSSGTVNLVYDPETELEGKDILLVEDIVDSGSRSLASSLPSVGKVPVITKVFPANGWGARAAGSPSSQVNPQALS